MNESLNSHTNGAPGTSRQEGGPTVIPFSGREGYQPRTRRLPTKEERRLERERKLERFFKILITVLVTVLIIQVAYHLYFAGKMRFSDIVISAAPEIKLSNRDILEAAGVDSSTAFFSVNPGEIVDRLEQHPAVSSAEVEKRFPNHLTLILKGRKPLVLALAERGGETVPAVMDREGIVFATGGGVEQWDLPVVSGVRFPEIQAGSRLPESLCGFLHQLNALKQSSPALFNLISEIKFVKKNSVEFEVLLFIRDYPVRVRLGRKINPELMTYIVMVLDMVSRDDGLSGVEELDFRAGEIVYRMREG